MIEQASLDSQAPGAKRMDLAGLEGSRGMDL